MKVAVSILFILLGYTVFAQKATFDITTYTPPKGWKKAATENLVEYSIVDKKKNTWCQIGILKSTISKGSIEQDFESEWEGLVAKPYKPGVGPNKSQIEEADGWKIMSGGGQFTFNKSNAIVLLTTLSGFDRCVSIVATTNSQVYLKDIEALMSSLDLKKPLAISQQIPAQSTIKKETVPQTAGKGFTFTTTNFDDGWTSTVQEDWVQVVKGDVRVLIHYPNKQADAYNSVLLDGLKNAWNVLVAPRYNTVSDLEFKPLIGWQSIEFAEANAIEKTTNKAVHVVFFKMNYSNGSGKYLEFITADKQVFEREFGPYHQSTYGWEKMESMANYNKFAVAASDLNGKWTNNFSGFIQYVNAYTGFDAGANTHASAENFQLGPGNTYKWDLGVASGAVGNIKFQSVKSSGKFSMVGNWQINFSDIEGKPRTYNTYFSCIKGFRILWIDNKAFARVE